MRIQLMSDIHMEFEEEGGIQEFIGSLDSLGVDVLILAGDICTMGCVQETMDSICERYAGSTVIWVKGNHEYYRSNRDEVDAVSRTLMQRWPNLQCLDRNIIEVGGKRFLGGTMWFPEPKDGWLKGYLNDYRCIKDFESWVYDLNKETEAFIARECKKGDIVVTHHLPHPSSVPRQFKGSDMNCFYVHDMRYTIMGAQPALWMHGHTHESCDYTIEHGQNVTRVVCNPRGYMPNALNPKFSDHLIIEV